MLGLALAEEFTRRGHVSDVLTVFVGDGSFVFDLEASGLTLHAADFHGKSVAKRLFVPAYLYRLFKSQAYDAIHCHHMGVFFHCLHPARLARVPRIVVTEHAHQHFAGNTRLIQRSRRLGPRADAVTVIHDELRQFFQADLRIPTSRLKLISNAVDVDLYQPRETTPAIRNIINGLGWSQCIGCVSRMHVDKDVPNLIRAFRIVADHTDNKTGLIVVGDGPERAAVEALVEQFDLRSRVFLAGTQTNIADWLSAFDLFVLPSRREGVPLAILEALSSGLPIAATNVGGVSDVVDDSVGRLSPSENPEMLAKAVLTILKDKNLRSQMARNARRKAVSDYSFSNMADQYLDILQGRDA